MVTQNTFSVVFYFIVFCFGVFISGCATIGSTNNQFIEAESYNVTNEKYFDKDPSLVWDKLVRELSKSFYMINNIDKESRIINVSYNSNNVCNYVDCGSVHVDVKKGSVNKFGQDSYDFKICESNSYISESSAPNQSGIKSPIVCSNRRKPNLEGRMNIYLAPEGNGTLVTVNSRFILDIKLKSDCEFYAPAGNLVNRHQYEKAYECSFDSRKPSLCDPDTGSPSFMCYSTGNLESEVLGLIH